MWPILPVRISTQGRGSYIHCSNIIASFRGSLPAKKGTSILAQNSCLYRACVNSIPSAIASCPARVHLPARSGLVNEVKFLGFDLAHQTSIKERGQSLGTTLAQQYSTLNVVMQMKYMTERFHFNPRPKNVNSTQKVCTDSV